LAVPKNKVCLKETNISGTENILKNLTTTLKAIPQEEFQKCFKQ